MGKGKQPMCRVYGMPQIWARASSLNRKFMGSMKTCYYLYTEALIPDHITYHKTLNPHCGPACLAPGGGGERTCTDANANLFTNCNSQIGKVASDAP